MAPEEVESVNSNTHKEVFHAFRLQKRYAADMRSAVCKNALPLLVDNLFAFRDGKSNGIIPSGMCLRTHETMFPNSGRRIFFDGTSGLELTLRRIWRRPDPEPLVFNRFGRRCLLSGG